MSAVFLHNLRSTPIKGQRGGHRPGAGRPRKENHDPNWPEHLSQDRQRTDAHDRSADYIQQQHQLANHKGRSWTYDECVLLLTLIIGLVLHYGDTPTDVLRFVSATIHRSYEHLHTLWSKWQQERHGTQW